MDLLRRLFSPASNAASEPVPAIEPAPPPAAPAPAPVAAAPAPAPVAGAPARPAGVLNLKTKWLDLDYIEVPEDGRTMRFAATGSSSLKRIRSLFDKEPITLAWIETFDENALLYDIGGNVGMYTVYAGVMRNARVVAFEPEALNYAELNKNIYLNNMHDRVLAYCCALSDVDKADKLLLSDFGLGISYHDFEEDSWTGDKEFSPDWHVKKEGRRAQGCLGRKLDSMIAEGMPFPDHIKIDVDGLEHRVIAGMMETLRDPRLKTVLIEINFDNPKNLEIIAAMEAMGWRYSWEQLQTHRKVRMPRKKIEQYQREGVGGLNYIFFRDDFYADYFRTIFDTYEPGVRIDSKAAMGR